MTLIDLHGVRVTLQAEIRVRLTLMAEIRVRVRVWLGVGIRVGAWVIVRVVQTGTGTRCLRCFIDDLLTFEFFRLR